MASGWECPCPAWDDASLAGCQVLPPDLAHMLPHQCPVCFRSFKSPSSLENHLKSGAHDAKNIKCPKCSRGFKSASACTQHIESRACVDISRQQIVNGVKEWEARTRNVNLLTVPRIGAEQIADREEDLLLEATYAATEAAHDGWGYRCCICSGAFSTLLALNQHLNSAAHESQEYRCRKCGIVCVLLSALIQHVESRVCGAATSEDLGYELAEQFPRLYIEGVKEGSLQSPDLSETKPAGHGDE